MDIPGYPWISRDIHGPWISLDIHGYVSLDIHGYAYPWISRISTDYPRIFLPAPYRYEIAEVDGQ
eukprot:3174966-Prymnesium_polylepis.1